MYFDDSHTEVKVTDVTHCDLETKSILKPPKARAPLQEVDLGNHIAVEFDVIRKRRVSFAGVNKIKEFNSEAKSFSIYCTPAYEEKISTSSDSSALSSSASGNINILTKENDITILDDTMDITDLSIVQSSAMDITGIKPQIPLQGVPDIFAPRSQDSGLFGAQQDINRPIFTYEINNPNVKDGLEPNLSQTKSGKLNKPEDTPLALDPRKLLLNELLEESAADFSVDNYLKANTLFSQNNCNIHTNKCEAKKPLEVSGMDFTLPPPLAESIKPGSHHIQPTVEKGDLESENMYTNIISNIPSNVFSSLDMDMKQCNKIQDNLLEMEYQNNLHKPRQSTMFPNVNNDISTTTKIDVSQMEFTEALPSKNLAQSNVVANNCTVDRLLASTGISHKENLNPPQTMRCHMNLNSNYCESRPGNSNSSQMEFAEALPSKYKYVVDNNYQGDKVATKPDISQMKYSEPSQNMMQSNMIPILNHNESSRTAKSFNASQMEFTEALPSKDIRCHTLVTNIQSATSVSQIMHSKPIEKSMPSHVVTNFNTDESHSSKNNNVSLMEFTEALPSKNVVPPNFNMDESRKDISNNVFQMEFTEALPSKHIGFHNLFANFQSTTSESQIPPSKSLSSHVVHNFNNDESNTAKNNSASQMELTEALPSKNLIPPNFNTDESSLAEGNNASQMEFTEALPSKNIVRQTSLANLHCTSSVTQIEHSKPLQKLIPSHLVPNFNIDESRTAKSNNASQMEFTEALPSKNVLPPNVDRTFTAESNNTTQMELTEALPSQNVKQDLSNVVANDYIEDRLLSKSPDCLLLMPLKRSWNKLKNDMIPNLNTDESKSINSKDASERQFIEALPVEPSYNNIIVSNYTGDRLQGKLNISLLVSEKPSQYDIQNDMFFNLNIEECTSLKKNNGPEMESPDFSSLDADITDNMVRKSNILVMVHSNSSQDMIQNEMIPNLNIAKTSESNNVSQMEFTEALPSNNLPFNNIITGKFKENKLLACSTNVSHIEDLKINLNSKNLVSNNYQVKSDFVGCTEKFSGTSQMELTGAVSSRPSTSNSSCVHRKTGQNVILDRKNIPPSQNLNESNSMDVTEIGFIASENRVYNVNSESNAKIIDKTSLTDLTKQIGIRLVNEGDVSNMEFTEGLPMNVLISGGKTELKMQSMFKDTSQMEFTEALPTRNIQSALNPVNSGCATSSQIFKNNVFSPSNNLQTSNMEFTEVLPMFKTKQDTINNKGSTPSCDILQSKIISPEQNLNVSCSMDVTDIQNLPDHDEHKNLIGGSEISDKKTDLPELESREILGDEHNKNSQNFPLLSASQNNFVIGRKTAGELQSDFSQLEFTEAIPVSNLINQKMVQDIFSKEVSLLNKKKSTVVSPENDSLAASSMEFTKFVQKPNPQHFIFDSENEDKEKMNGRNEAQNEIITPPNEGNFDNFCSEDLTRMKNIVKHAIVEKSDEVYVQDSSNKNGSCELAIRKNEKVDTPQMEFLHDLQQEYKNFNVPSKSYENMFPVANELVYDTTQMEFTEANLQQIDFKENIEVEEKRSDVLVDSELDINKISNASQMELIESIAMPKYQSDSNQNVKDLNVNNNETTYNDLDTIETEEVFLPKFDNNLEILSLASSDKQKNISSYENELEMDTPIIEDVKIADIENTCFKDFPNEKSSKNKIICTGSEIHQNVIKNEPPLRTRMDFVTISSHMISSDKDKSQDLAELNKVKSESVSLTQNLELLSPMSSMNRKDNKVNSLRKIFENESKLDCSRVDFNTPKGKQCSMIKSAKGSNCESSNKSVGNSKSSSTVVETLTVDDFSEKKNLVHFNTPPVRITKRRKTMGFANPEESVQLLKSNTSDLAYPLHDVSNVLNFQNSSQRRGIFDEKKKSAYDPEKGKQEWNRLVKNDAFMKERSFHFVSPCKWKYQFRWPMELVVKIPDIEVNENSRKKTITLVSNISESDHISIFIHNRMRKNMSVILSEEWLNSHCKTIKDLLFTIKFVEEEYNKLEPLISSMKYFYQEFPFDFSSDRIIFNIVNLRKEFCFEVRIDVSYGQVKGKNIDIINHVGQISKTKVQQLFDQLQPNIERFYLFWQKLMQIDVL